MPAPLDGVRVTDFTHYQAGPVCTLMLRDLGAEVIKVEPLDGEPGRWGGARPTPFGESLTFQVHSRGKKSMTVDLRNEDGKEVVRDLIRVSDVVVENFRPGSIARLGFGYDDVVKINPSVVMASISGFGQTGPYSTWPAVDMVAQAMSGLMEINGEPGGPPTKYGAEMADYSGGIFGALSVAGALYRRALTGAGEYVDMAMLDAMVYQLNYHPIRYKFADIRYGRIGNRVAGSGIAGAYRCKDGYVAIAPGGDIRWKQLTDLMGRSDLFEDPRYATVDNRWELHDELDREVNAWTETFTVDEAMKKLHGADQICGPVNMLDDIFEDEQIAHRKMLVETEHPLHGALTLPGSVFKMRNATPPPVDSAAPLLAEHNGYVLSELLGYTNERLRHLEQNYIVISETPAALAEG